MSTPSTGQPPTLSSPVGPSRSAGPPRPATALRDTQALPPGSGRAGIRPPVSEDSIVFRESFLVYLESCERPLLRRLGERIFNRVLESKAPRQRPLPGEAPRQRPLPGEAPRQRPLPGEAPRQRPLPGEAPRGRGFDPWTHRRLRALALDLGFAAELLGEIAAEPEHSDPIHEDERRLQALAPEWAAAVEEIVRLIEQAVDDEPRTH